MWLENVILYSRNKAQGPVDMQKVSDTDTD